MEPDIKQPGFGKHQLERAVKVSRLKASSDIRSEYQAAILSMRCASRSSYAYHRPYVLIENASLGSVRRERRPLYRRVLGPNQF